MLGPLIAAVSLTIGLGILTQKALIQLSYRFQLLDIPTGRRRHPNPTPIVGGVGIFLTAAVGIGFLSYQLPEVFAGNERSLLVLGSVASVLLVLGLWDDLKGLSPIWKLGTEILLAWITITYEPTIHEMCGIWRPVLGVFTEPLALIWIVGITNSINLIDGLDGLAAGMSALVLSSLGFLCWIGGPETLFPWACVIALIGSILPFLRVNWNPARIFLGDNGSLVLGYLISAISLMYRPNTQSWVMVGGILLMLGYPILDMGLAVKRRYSKRFPLFKADRNHLHYRLLRLGLTVRQTTVLILSVGLFLQFAALCIHLINPRPAFLAIMAVCCNLFTLLHLIRSIERKRVENLFRNATRKPIPGGNEHQVRRHTLLHIELEPLLEAALLEERNRHEELIASLQLLLKTLIRPDDVLYRNNQKLSVIFSEEIQSPESLAAIRERFQDKINYFIDLYDLQCSLAGIPVSIEQIETVDPVSAAKLRVS